MFNLSWRVGISASFSLSDLVNARLALTPEHMLTAMIVHFAEHCPGALVPYFLRGGVPLVALDSTYIRPVPALGPETVARILSCDNGQLREIVATGIVPQMASKPPTR